MAAVGVGAAVASFLLSGVHPWTSNLLANIAVVVTLLIPGEWLLARIRSDVRRVEEATDDIRDTAESARQVAEDTARSLEDIRSGLLDRQYEELNERLDTYRDIVRVPTRVSLIRALRQATDEEIITARGVRSPVWWTELHYRYVLGDDPTDLVVCLEKDDGTVVSSHSWDSSVSAQDFYQQLVHAVRDAGADLGTGLNDPTESVEQLSKMLVEVAQLRSQEPMGHRDVLRRIIERRDDWYFTERFIVPGNHLSYTIGVDRLNELDWEQHLSNKGWEGAASALEFARRLYGAKKKDQQPAGDESVAD